MDLFIANRLSDTKGILMPVDVSFARTIRQMETDEVKRLNYDQMLAYAEFEYRTLKLEQRFGFFDDLMRTNGQDKINHGNARPSGGKVDAGRMFNPPRNDARIPLRMGQPEKSDIIWTPPGSSIPVRVSAKHFVKVERTPTVKAAEKPLGFGDADTSKIQQYTD